MRILRWIREKKENKFQDQKKEILINELEKLKSGNLSSLKYVYGGLTYKDSEINKNIGKAISDCFDGKSLVEIIKYAEGFKEASLLEYCFEFKDFNLSDIKSDFENENEYKYLLELGSFHPNGYFRERCLIEMGNCQGTLPFIILRLNDWVEEIRECALNQTFEKMKSCTISEVINSLVSIEKINNSSRRDDEKINGINKLFKSRIEKDIKSISMDKILTYGYKVRKNIYKLVFSKEIITQEEAEYLLENEKQSYCKMLILYGIYELYKPNIEYVDGYLKNKNSQIKKESLKYKYSKCKNSWDGLENILLDKSSSVRNEAAWILKKHSNINILDYYKNSLNEGNIIISIIGIGENGSINDADLILPYLKNEDNKTVRITLASLGKLLKCKGDYLYWEYLLDERETISKTAYKCICNNDISYGLKKLFDEYNGNKSLHIRKYLLLLMLNENSWERLPYLISLYSEIQSAFLKDKILKFISKRDMYAKISPKSAELIKSEILKVEGILPENILEGIIFDLKNIPSNS